MKEIDVVDNIYNYTAKLSIEMGETTDAFIFRGIAPFINDAAGFEISKRELLDAVQLIRLKKMASEKYGTSLNCDLTKATDMSRELGIAYDRGFKDGRRSERMRLVCMLEEDLEE